MTTEITTSQFQQVRLFTGKVIHLLDSTAPSYPNLAPERQPALCNFRPVWPGNWIVENSDLPFCGTCAKIKEGIVGDSSS